MVVTRKLRPALSVDDAAAAVAEPARMPVVPIDADLVLEAVKASRRFSISYWDALIIETARAAGCETVLSEDLSHGQVYDGVRVENPFKA